MISREFRLPRINDLNAQQRAVRELASDGQYLVVGSPGTGKSVVALHRALEYKANSGYLFLTFNHVLQTATQQVFDGVLNCNTALSWFYKMCYDGMPGDTFEEKKLPEIEGTDRDLDYEKIVEILRCRIDSKEITIPVNTHLIIDEGQDLPINYYEALRDIGFENFFIVADQNQTITSANSSVSEIQNFLALADDDIVELKENYRNTSIIAKLANHFYTDPASPMPLIPERYSIDTPVLFSYSMVNNVVDLISNIAIQNPAKLIGVITATDTKREDYFKKISKKTSDNGTKVSTYCSRGTSDSKAVVNIDFSLGGVVVLCDKSVKGVEFDIVYIIMDDLKITNNDIDAVKKRLYVMTSRAKERLYLVKSQSKECELEPLLPADELLLRRENL
jgi:DNA helicase IV